MIITLARASDQIRRGLNNRSQWGCHCCLFWCVHCDEAEIVPCSLTYRLLLIYSSAAHLPCHPLHMTRVGKRKQRDKRELSTTWSLLKLDGYNIFWREAEWKWTNWGKGCLTPLQLVRRRWNSDYDVFGNERDKNTGGSKRALITVMRKKVRRGRGENKLESSLLIMLSYFDVSVAYTLYFYHLWLLVNTWWQRITFVSRGGGGVVERDMLI